MTWRRALRGVVRTPTGRLAVGLVGILIVVALVSLVWTPYDPAYADIDAPWVGPLHGGHVLGTDRIGRDELSLLMAGA